MPNTKTICVPHLGGIDAAYQMPKEYDPTKPTVVLVNAFTTSSDLYRRQFGKAELNEAMNLVAIESLGHGQTRTGAVDLLGHSGDEFASLGCFRNRPGFRPGHQPGWMDHGADGSVAARKGTPGRLTRKALVADCTQILGIIPIGTSMDSESERTRQLQCWNGPAIVSSFVKQWESSEGGPDFQPDDGYCNALIDIGFNECGPDVCEFWRAAIKENYRGEEGRRRIRMAAINLAERGGLHLRLSDVRCPVLWLHGTKDAVYSVANAIEEIGLFTGSPDAQLVQVEGGAHFLNCSHPEEVERALLQFVNTYK